MNCEVCNIEHEEIMEDKEIQISNQCVLQYCIKSNLDNHEVQIFCFQQFSRIELFFWLCDLSCAFTCYSAPKYCLFEFCRMGLPFIYLFSFYCSGIPINRIWVKYFLHLCFSLLVIFYLLLICLSQIIFEFEWT